MEPADRAKLNLGCGHIQPAGWTNVDGSNRAWLASRLPWLDRLLVRLRLVPPTEFNRTTVYANLSRRLPWDDETAGAVYMGDLLTHLTPADGFHIVKESFRVLCPSGVVRLRVCDQVQFWRQYIAEFESTLRRPQDQWDLNHVRWTKMYFNNICVVRPKAWASMGHFRKWMYDEISITLLLQSAGFVNVRRMPFHQSAVDDVKSVESRDDLIVEAIKPPGEVPRVQ